MNRRTFLTAAGITMAEAATPPPPAMTIIDTHIHLFDTTRPQGVPWPPKDSAVLYKPALPDRYRAISAPFGITGAIEVEASPWLEDNQWVLDVAAANPIILGMIGNLEPGKPDFRKNLERFRRNPLFLGIRYGNLWDRDFHAAVSNPAFVADVRAVADAGLTLDSANPNPELIEDLVRLTDQVPTLRVVIDHLPQLTPPAEPAALHAYSANLRKLGDRPQVYVKLSGVLRRVDGKVPTDLAFYRSRLDELFAIFGPDRVLFGSDWPNSDQWGPYPQVFHLVSEYFQGKTQAEREKYFSKNSVAAYRWVARKS